jgi:hypothetical protein
MPKIKPHPYRDLQIRYRDTKSNILTLSGVEEGAIAYATDTDELGFYKGSSWAWISASSGGVDADTLDGQHGSYYTNANNISTGTLSVSRGGTGLSSLTSGHIPFGQGTSPLGTDSNLYWDNTNKRLGLRTTPSETLDVNGNIKANYYKLPKQFYCQFDDLANGIFSGVAIQGWTDFFQSRPVSDVQYWNGSSWVTWNVNATALFDGARNTAFYVPTDRSKFRLTVETAWWTGGGILNIYTEWVAHGPAGYNYLVEISDDKSTWLTVDSGSVPGDTYQAYIANLPHTQHRYYRITIDFGSISVGQLIVWIRALSSRLLDWVGILNGLPISSTYEKGIVIEGSSGVGVPNPVISDGKGLHIGGKIIRLDTSKTPASSTAAGYPGEICWDNNYLYVCVGTNTWKRVALSSW